MSNEKEAESKLIELRDKVGGIFGLEENDLRKEMKSNGSYLDYMLTLID